MLYSMTGYGKSENKNEQIRVVTEIKSLNSKSIDINLKAPYWLKPLELNIRDIIFQKLQRGKIDVSVSIELSEGLLLKQYNAPAVRNYFLQLRQLAQFVNIDTSNPYITASLFREAISTPDANNNNTEEILNEFNQQLILNSVTNACETLNHFRKTEGEKMEQDILNQINLLQNFISKIKQTEHLRIPKIKEKILNNLKNNFDESKIDKNRFEQEIIYYLEKLDINEEIVRLNSHLIYFIDTCKDGYNKGKKLAFIAQEIGREINTIGSKANDEQIQKTVVEMKDILEKIKEQLNNIL